MLIYLILSTIKLVYLSIRQDRLAVLTTGKRKIPPTENDIVCLLRYLMCGRPKEPTTKWLVARLRLPFEVLYVLFVTYF